MCTAKEEASTKIDRLIQAMDRLSSAMQRLDERLPPSSEPPKEGIPEGVSRQQ